MNNIITEEQIETATNEYLEKNKDDIEKLINKKIETAVNKSISNAFSTSYSGWARKMIESTVDEKVKSVANNVLKETTINKEDITRRVNKKIQAKLRKINIDIDF